MLALLLQNPSSLIIVSYSNVSYETLVPGLYVYFVPVQDSHFGGAHLSGPLFGVSPYAPYEMYLDPSGYIGNGNTIGWNTGDFIYNAGAIGIFPNGNAWGRYQQPPVWSPSGNTGNKTLAQWNALQADVLAGTKQNLIGTPVYG